ncbi:uncharacterized protein E0L32_006939 [Thyridium curvatum]|uniref:Amine oxidase n=1 Tax=Thyridium curvatum TaxID=1093900 RepID=A0A507AQM8_9PEZI|nr:uncharacterized protein E0L32_006939 [Thyridium curvatum]TPX12292.1 hypothetical protein E0L32_006939 [Thyridium curvatum]
MWKLKTLLFSVGLAGATVVPPLGLDRRLLHDQMERRSLNKTSGSACGLGKPAPIVAAPKLNVWSQITPEDNLAVWKLLHDPKTGLNLTDPATAGINDNYVFWIDTLHTNKSAVLPYLDGSGVPPSKYARVIIFEGGKQEPVSQEYQVGPLPVSAQTKVEKLDWMYNGGMGGAVPYNGRHNDFKKMSATDTLVNAVMGNISDITAALFQGGVYYGARDNRTTLMADPYITPTSFDGSQGFQIIIFRVPGLANYLTPIDLYVIVDCPGTDISKYKLKGIVTNSRFFPTVADLRAAFEAGELVQEFAHSKDSSWLLDNYHPDMGTRDLEEQFAPQNLEIGGKRYKLDEKQQYVEYLGWSFYVAYTRSLGIMYYDIRFKGERILYELSMQEAAAQYGGFTPKAAGTVYHDTYFELGTNISPLVEGYDCPFGSTFWNMTYHTGNKTTINQKAICIFEQDSGFPLSRHRYGGGSSEYGFEHLGSTKGSALTVRSIATVGNYDYLFDYMFHVDGSLEVMVRASGYLQSSFYYKDQGNWGPRIAEATQGSLHDHVLTWKADFDVIDSNNSLQLTRLQALNTTQPWFPELGTFEQLTLNKSIIATEKQWNWDDNSQAMYCVLSKSAKNAWGEPRGYRIIPRLMNMHLSTLNSPFSLRNLPFAKSHAAVTRQHDNEPYANSVQNLNLPMKPQQDFAKFFDGESIDGEDLVVWFNLGMHHFTRAEDIPVTLFTEAVSSIMFAPQNFFDKAQDVDLQNRRWITPDPATKGLNVETYGVELPQCKIELEEPGLKVGKVSKTDSSQ